MAGVAKFNNNQTPGENFFTGTFNPHKEKLNYDPYVSGYAFIFWENLPSWMTEDSNGVNRQMFKPLTQKNFKSLDGLSNIELETGEHVQGFAGTVIEVPTTLNKGNQEFTLSHQEFSGLPLTKMYRYWVTGIRDPETGVATYPVRDGVEQYGARYHTANLLYVTTRPDANNTDGNIIEFACYWTYVYPTTIPLDPYNFEEGTHDLETIEQSFRGNIHISPQVDEYASQKIEEAYQFKTMRDYETSN